MTAFSDMIDDLWDSDLAEDAVYKAAETGELTPLRVIVKAADKISNFGSSRALTSTVNFEIRQSDVAAPKEGDQISLDTKIYTIQGAPESDAQSLVWKLNVFEEE